MKKLACLFLAIVLTVSFTLPAFAAETGDVDTKIAALEQKYDIRIRYDTTSSGGACIGTGALATLDAMLALVTPEVVREVSSYTQGRTGNKLTYYFTYDFNVDLNLSPDEEVLGSFSPSTGVIELYVPSSSQNTYSSGENPVTMIHEFAHALHTMVEDRYGASALETSWTSLNGTHSYKGYLSDGNYSDTTFFSEYASTEFGEDFAETFAHSVVRNRAGLGFYYLLTKDGLRTNLGRKVDFLTEVLSKSVNNSAGLVATIRNNSSNTAIYANYQGVQLYGIKLQYIGCTWPTQVLKGIMGAIGEDVASSTWIYEIGGWYAQGSSGKYYLIFPGGYAQTLNGPLQAA